MADDPITGGEELGGKLLDLIGKFVPDRDKQLELQAGVMAAIQSANNAQNEINKAYAASNSFYMAGARPAFLWIGVAYFLYSYILVPIIMYGCYALGHPIPKPPALDEHIYELVTLLLGVSGMRTYEKIQGAA